MVKIRNLRTHFEADKIRKHYDNIKIYLLVSIGFLSIEPWIIWGNFKIVHFLSIFYFLFFILSKRKLKKYLFFPIIVFTYMAIPRGYDDYYDLKMSYILMFLIVSFLINENYHVRKQVFIKFVNIIALLLVPGILLYLIHYVINIPYYIIPSRNLVLVQDYRNYLFFIEAVQDVDVLPRFRFIFDEAGVVGSLFYLLLLIQKFRIKTWQNCLILTGGLLSFSLFFYLASFITVLLFNITKIQTTLKTLFLVPILLTVLVIIFWNNSYIDNLIFDRLNTSSILGEKRTNAAFNYYFDNQLINSSAILYGIGMGSSTLLGSRDAAIASYKAFLFEYGIIGIILLVIFYFRILHHFLDITDSIILLFGLALIFYQRPWLYLYFNNILLISGASVFYELPQYNIRGSNNPTFFKWFFLKIRG